MERVDAVVVGAGPAGLATSRELARRGVGHVVLERGDAVGASWRAAYDGLTLHTGKHLSALAGLRHGRSAPLFLPRDAFVAYLERYAARFALPVRTGCEVTRAERGEGGWVLDSTSGPLRARRLVLATGIMANPLRPRLEGEARFRGRILHSVDYRRPAPFRGRRVVVVGCGNSAAEIATELAAAGVSVTLSVRSGANVVPLRILGVPIQYLGFVVGQLPRPMRGAILAAVRWATEVRSGPIPLPRPAVGPLDAIPVIGLRLLEAIRAGQIDVRGAVHEVGEERVRFRALGSGGAAGAAGAPARHRRSAADTDEPADDIILATGFRAAVGPVRHAVGLDRAGFLRRRDRVVALDAPDLFVVGHNYDATGGLLNIRRDAPRAARRIAAARP